MVIAPHISFDTAAYFVKLDRKIDNGEGDQPIPRYDPSLEELPMDRVSVFHPAFAKAEELIQQRVLQHTLNAVRALRLKNPSTELELMGKRIIKLLIILYKGLSIVGIDGNAGMGKTSILNTLLDLKELAHTVPFPDRGKCNCQLIVRVEFGSCRHIHTDGVPTHWRACYRF